MPWNCNVIDQDGLIDDHRLKKTAGTLAVGTLSASGSTSSAPAFTTIPSITFAAGIPATQSIASYLSDPTNLTRATELIQTAVLPPGVRWNPSTMTFHYNGYSSGSDEASTVTARAHYYPETDEQLWSTESAGALYSYDLNGDDTAAMHAEALDSLRFSQLSTSGTQFVTGGNSIRFELRDVDGATGSSWARENDGDAGNLPSRFYSRWSMYHPRDTFAYRPQHSGSEGNLKLLNIGQYGGGQIVVTCHGPTGCVTAFINGGPNLVEPFGLTSDTPFQPTQGSQGQFQNAIDANAPDPDWNGSDGTTIAQWHERYGPFYDGTLFTFGMTYDAAEVWLDERDNAQNYPPNDFYNAVVIEPDCWMVYEIFVDIHPTVPGQSSFQLWGAPYGMPPRLAISWIGNVPLSSSGNNEWRLEWSDYDTNRLSQAGVRPTMYTYVDQIINSLTPIDFPGGHTPPSNQG